MKRLFLVLTVLVLSVSTSVIARAQRKTTAIGQGTLMTHSPVKTCIHPGGHIYPPWAADEIVKFFKAHKRTNPS